MNCKTSVSEIWNKMRRISGKSRKTRVTAIKLPDGTISDDIAVKCETIAKQFEQNSSSQNYEDSFIRIKQRTEERTIKPTNSHRNIYDDPFTMIELQEALDTCKDTSPGPDGIHYLMIKNLPRKGKEILLRIYNDIWMNKFFPDCWKEALTIPIPIHKTGKPPDDPTSYRPIALTNCFCKLMEKNDK